ncbi:MAG: glycoside hydrolase [Euryarchaeota archaeon]|nr:glycoside hydrolase [Euryarchaeota archaeon]
MAGRSRAPLVAAMVLVVLLAGCTSDQDRKGDGAEGATPDTDGSTGAPPTPLPSSLPDPDGSRLDRAWLHNGSGLMAPSDGVLMAFGYAALPKTVEVHTGYDGAEPSIGVTPEGNLFVIAGTQTLRSSDGGLSWEVVKRDPITADPLLWVDRDTGRVFTVQLYVGCSYLHHSDDEGEAWEVNPVACGLPVNDHQKMTTAPRTVANPTASYPNVVYYCASQIAAAQCSVSQDGGKTFVGTFAVPPGQCGGVHGMPWGAQDGMVYLPYISCSGPAVAVTEDNGASWTVREGPPGRGGGGFDPDAVTTPDGTLYLMYTGSDHLPYLVRSKDKGATWDGPFALAPEGVGSSVFAALAVGDDGRLAATYVATDDHKGRPDSAPANATWDLYIAMTLDGDAADPWFLTLQASKDPVQRGRVCTEGAQCDDARNLLDFIDATVDHEGRVYVASTDGCTSRTCTGADGTAASSKAGETTVYRIDEGPSLLAKRPWLMPLGDGE